MYLRGIVWLEMPFYGQAVQNMDADGVRTLLRTLDSKLSIDDLLVIKAEAQSLQVLEQPEADGVYTAEWARNTAFVTQIVAN